MNEGFTGIQEEIPAQCALNISGRTAVPLKWSDDLRIGVEEIDRQHEELFGRIDNLLSVIRQGRGREEVAALITFLEGYMVMHFGVEEKYMEDYDYPDFMSHRARHARFSQEFSAIKARFDSEGATVELVMRMSTFLTDWWINHIRTVDKMMGVFLSKKI